MLLVAKRENNPRAVVRAMNMTVMEDAEVTETDHWNPIDAIEKNYEGLFLVSVGLRAPSAGAIDAARKAHQAVQFHMNRVLSMPPQEIETFMDSLTDLVKKGPYPEKQNEYKDRIDMMGAIGGILGSIERNIRSLNDEQRRAFIRESIAGAVTRVDEMVDLIGDNVLSTQDMDRFKYLVLAQAVFLKSKKMLGEVLSNLRKGKDLDKDLLDLYILAIFALLRVEAFRRGKISLSDLGDTYTILLTISPSDLSTYGFKIDPISSED